MPKKTKYETTTVEDDISELLRLFENINGKSNRMRNTEYHLARVICAEALEKLKTIR